MYDSLKRDYHYSHRAIDIHTLMTDCLELLQNWTSDKCRKPLELFSASCILEFGCNGKYLIRQKTLVSKNHPLVLTTCKVELGRALLVSKQTLLHFPLLYRQPDHTMWCTYSLVEAYKLFVRRFFKNLCAFVENNEVDNFDVSRAKQWTERKIY